MTAMHAFTFHNPVKLIFGTKQVNEIGSVTASLGKRALIVSYRDVRFMTNLIDVIHKN